LTAFAPAASRMGVLPRSRAVRIPLLSGALGAAVAASAGAAPPRDVDSLALALGGAANGVVAPSEIRWEPSLGWLSDFVRGRRVLFLSRHEGAPRDVWRARVRLSPEGRPLEVVDAHDLTDTELGDDHALVVDGRYAAFATSVYGQEQSVSLLDLEGEGAQNQATKLSDRAMACITNIQRTGVCEGVGRVDVVFENPARAVGLALSEAALAIELADARPCPDHAAPASRTCRRTAILDFDRGDIVPAVEGLHAEAALHLPKRLSHWAVDTVRAVPWIGAEPIAWLEDTVFSLRDDAKRFAFKVGGPNGAEDQLAITTEPPPPALDTSLASVEEAHWPPAKLPTIWKSPEAGEGEWTPPAIPWMRRMPGVDASAPSPFYRTFLRPDEERPYAKVLLVAFDTRQLDLDMEAGNEDPRPLTGPNGPGKLPRDPAILSRVVAAFNGAFKTEHGSYGMMVHKRLLLPPQPGAATVATLSDGRVGLGSWGANKTVSGIQGVSDDAIESFRQNLDALVDHGQVNPSGRSLWGYSAPGKGIQTERSGLCVTTSGHLIYAWGDDVSATTLAKAMKTAGCDYGMHLDMNPFHTGFMFARIDDIRSKRYQTELLTTQMEIPKDRYVEWSPKDFFYLMLHDPTPPELVGSMGWKADGGSQPAPAWLPGIWTNRLSVAKVEVDVLDVERGRAAWRIRGGTKDAPAANALRDLTGDDATRALMAIGLGASDEKRPLGLATDGKLAVPMRGGADWAALVVRPDGTLSIQRAFDGATLTPATDVAELPLVLYDGAKISSELAGSARAALGTTSDGRVLLARSGGDAPLAEVLAKAGCTRVVLLDRGAGVPSFVHRSGLGAAPLARYDETVLYAIATPMKPRAFRFDATTPYVAPTKK
jgi:hypothetical protein